MATYVVSSSNLTVAPEGSTVTDEQLQGCDIPALIAAGHLTPTDAPPAEDPSGAPEDPELAAAQAELAKAQADLAAAQQTSPTTDPAGQADTPKE